MTEMELRHWLAQHRQQLTSPPPRLDDRATPAPKIEFEKLLASEIYGATSRSDDHVS